MIVSDDSGDEDYHEDYFTDADLEGKESPVTTELLPSEGEGKMMMLQFWGQDI